MEKKVILQNLKTIADLLEILGENPFRAKAYRQAANNLEEEDLETLLAEDRLQELPGIGPTLKEEILEMAREGRSQKLSELLATLSPNILDLLKIPGLGPKKVKALRDQLAIDSLEKLESACREDRLAQLKGFGAKTQDKLLASIQSLKPSTFKKEIR